MKTPRYSVIVPVYNRRDEITELAESLLGQTEHSFELVVVEDGSTEPCGDIIEDMCRRGLDAKYFFKSNEGRSIARNYGMERASGSYFVFFDSDCVIPPDYFRTLSNVLDTAPVDCYGGPDAAHESFSDTQKAINYAMTSFLTTGGIRGGKVRLDKFVPRTFNMGFSRAVYERVGGFREMFSEDIDMSTRIRHAGCGIGLIREVPVWHRRRVDLRRFFRQVYVFGMSRITLKLLYPDSMKLVHWLPAVFVLGVAAMVLLAVFVSPWWLAPLALYLFMIWQTALVSTSSLVIAFKAIPASLIQLGGYGCGFLKAYFVKIICRRGRDVAEEVAMRKGK